MRNKDFVSRRRIYSEDRSRSIARDTILKNSREDDLGLLTFYNPQK